MLTVGIMVARMHKGYSLAEAQEQLAAWKAAKAAAATGKSYQIGGRSLNRYDLADINAQIEFYAAIVAVLDPASSSVTRGPVLVRGRVMR